MLKTVPRSFQSPVLEFDTKLQIHWIAYRNNIVCLYTINRSDPPYRFSTWVSDKGKGNLSLVQTNMFIIWSKYLAVSLSKCLISLDKILYLWKLWLFLRRLPEMQEVYRSKLKIVIFNNQDQLEWTLAINNQCGQTSADQVNTSRGKKCSFYDLTKGKGVLRWTHCPWGHSWSPCQSGSFSWLPPLEHGIPVICFQCWYPSSLWLLDYISPMQTQRLLVLPSHFIQRSWRPCTFYSILLAYS